MIFPIHKQFEYFIAEFGNRCYCIEAQRTVRSSEQEQKKNGSSFWDLLHKRDWNTVFYINFL